MKNTKLPVNRYTTDKRMFEIIDIVRELQKEALDIRKSEREWWLHKFSLIIRSAEKVLDGPVWLDDDIDRLDLAISKLGV